MDLDLATLDDTEYHRIWYIIVYYCISEQKSSFQPNCHCSQHFQFLVKIFQAIMFLVFIDWYHSCTYIDYVISFISYNFKRLSVIYTAFDTNFYEDSFFSASVNKLNFKPWHSQYSRILRYTRTKRGTGINLSKGYWQWEEN